MFALPPLALERRKNMEVRRTGEPFLGPVVKARKQSPWCINTVYCDESGSTGNELLDSNQEYFVYASVALEPKEAADLTAHLISKHGIYGKELKGKNLLRHSGGRRLIDELIQITSGKAHLVVHHKKYALAAKFFEYMFEPVLADQSSIFYEVGFHKFISNLLYLWTLAQEKRADDILTDFAKAMRNQGPADLSVFATDRVSALKMEDPLQQIASFCLVHKHVIAKEIAGLHEIELGKWSLDLTSTSLFSVLSHWGDAFDQLSVYCDDSKPLREAFLFDAFVNRDEKTYQFIGGSRRLFTPNLAHAPRLVRSEEYCGVQLADVLASACRKALQERHDKDSGRWINVLAPSISAESVWHDVRQVDLDTPEARLNAAVLLELVDRSIKGKDVLNGMGEFVAGARRALSRSWPSLKD